MSLFLDKSSIIQSTQHWWANIVIFYHNFLLIRKSYGPKMINTIFLTLITECSHIFLLQTRLQRKDKRVYCAQKPTWLYHSIQVHHIRCLLVPCLPLSSETNSMIRFADQNELSLIIRERRNLDSYVPYISILLSLSRGFFLFFYFSVFFCLLQKSWCFAWPDDWTESEIRGIWKISWKTWPILTFHGE